MGEQSHEGDANFNHSMNDGAVAFLEQAREGMDKVEKWSASRELSLRGKTREWMDHINKEAKKWNTAISNVDRPADAELLYDASVSFATFAQVNPGDPQALAKAADAAYAYFSRLLERTKIPIVSDIGQLVESARHLFEFWREAFDPICGQPTGHITTSSEGPTMRHPNDQSAGELTRSGATAYLARTCQEER